MAAGPEASGGGLSLRSGVWGRDLMISQSMVSTPGGWWSARSWTPSSAPTALRDVPWPAAEMCFPSGCCRRPLARRRGLAAQQRGPPAGCGLPHDAASHRRPPQAPSRSRLSTSSDVAPCLLKSPFVHLDGTKQNHAAEAEARPTAARCSGGTSSSINGFT